MIGFGAPQPGDWVRTTDRVPMTWADHLTGGGLRPGTKGVVVGGTGRYLDVDFDTGHGSVRGRIAASQVRVVRRGGGCDRFDRRSRRMSAVRWAVTAFLVFPVLWWVASYSVAHRTLEGIVPAFALAVLDSAGGLLASAVEHPVQTVVYMLFLLALGRFARG